jgi:hypothetical protein
MKTFMNVHSGALRNCPERNNPERNSPERNNPEIFLGYLQDFLA